MIAIAFLVIGVVSFFLNSYLVHGKIQVSSERWPPRGYGCEWFSLGGISCIVSVIGSIVTGYLIYRLGLIISWLKIGVTPIFLFWAFIFFNLPAFLWYLRHGNHFFDNK